MDITRKIGIGIAAGVLTIGAGTSAFAAGTSGRPGQAGDGTGPRATFVCAHLDEITAQQQARRDLLDGRLHLLQEADAAATAGGDDQAAAKIEQRIETTNARIAKLTERQGHLGTWATAHCPTPG